MKGIDRARLLGHIEDMDSKVAISKILDKVERVLDTSEPEVSDFLDPGQREMAIAILKQITGIRFYRDGGYRDAERERILIALDIYPKELIDTEVVALEMTLDGKDASLTHRDWLGAIMGLGIRREKLGDIIIIDGGCQVVAAEEIKDFITSNMVKAGKFPVSVREIDTEALKVEPTRIKEIGTTVASMRLDSVAGEGFSVSRTKMAKEIKSEKVKVNWRTVNDPAYLVKVGDVISIKGRGRVEVESVSGETRKGRIRISLKRLM